MGRVSSLAAVIVVAAGAFAAPLPPAGGADSEDVVARHMVAEALLAAHLVAVAERAGMSPEGINTILKDVVARSAIDEFWITDESGRAYLTSADVEFTFVDDPQEQPQASAFWPLITGEAEVVIQEPRRREIDEQVFRYVGVAGVDRPRIVQVGVSAEGRPAPD